MVGLESRRNRLAVVIGPTNKFRAATLVTHTGMRRLMERVMVAYTTLRTGEPTSNAVHQGGVIHLQLDDGVQHHLLRLEHRIQRHCLWHGAGEAVEDEPLGAIRLVDSAREHGDHDLVRHQGARLHHSLGLQADLTASLQLSAQHVTGGDLCDPIPLFQDFRLCALARPRRP